MGGKCRAPLPVTRVKKDSGWRFYTWREGRSQWGAGEGPLVDRSSDPGQSQRVAQSQFPEIVHVSYYLIVYLIKSSSDGTVTKSWHLESKKAGLHPQNICWRSYIKSLAPAKKGRLQPKKRSAPTQKRSAPTQKKVGSSQKRSTTAKKNFSNSQKRSAPAKKYRLQVRSAPAKKVISSQKILPPNKIGSSQKRSAPASRRCWLA